MLKFLQSLSAVCFFLLGITFFVAFLFLRNNVQMIWSAWWMQVADLPLLVSAVTYGATSFMLSVKGRAVTPILIILVGLVSILFLGTAIVLNFWGVF
jgi:hypothetical protein